MPCFAAGAAARWTRRMTVFAKMAFIAGPPGHSGVEQPRDMTVRVDKRPNVLIIASDSLRSDHLSINGYHRLTSPAIDELAKTSVNFSKCFTPIASTVELLTTMMSSQYPHTHGLAANVSQPPAGGEGDEGFAETRPAHAGPWL